MYGPDQIKLSSLPCRSLFQMLFAFVSKNAAYRDSGEYCCRICRFRANTPLNLAWSAHAPSMPPDAGSYLAAICTTVGLTSVVQDAVDCQGCDGGVRYLLGRCNVSVVLSGAAELCQTTKNDTLVVPLLMAYVSAWISHRGPVWETGVSGNQGSGSETAKSSGGTVDTYNGRFDLRPDRLAIVLASGVVEPRNR